MKRDKSDKRTREDICLDAYGEYNRETDQCVIDNMTFTGKAIERLYNSKYNEFFPPFPSP